MPLHTFWPASEMYRFEFHSTDTVHVPPACWCAHYHYAGNTRKLVGLLQTDSREGREGWPLQRLRALDIQSGGLHFPVIHCLRADHAVTRRTVWVWVSERNFINHTIFTNRIKLWAEEPTNMRRNYIYVGHRRWRFGNCWRCVNCTRCSS